MKYLSIFASVLLATASAYGQKWGKCRTASDPTLQSRNYTQVMTV